jgi:Ca-activated chloride channel homolog
MVSAQEVAIVPRVRPAPAVALDRTEPLLRVDSALVQIPAHVTNALGAPVNNLSAAGFHIYEDDVEQTIASFNAEDAPVSVGLLFDASGSMHNKMRKAFEAAAQFFETANAGDEFFLVEIHGRVKLAAPFTTDFKDLLEQIRGFRPGGQTPLFDAIHLALKVMRRARNSRKALVILSDGGDNWSTHTFRQIRQDLLESDVQLFAMGIFDEDFRRSRPPEEARGPNLLDELTMQTGGRLYSVVRLDDLPEIGAKISRELRHQYVLGYYPSNGAQDGKYHHVKVTVSSELPDLRVSFRTGYYSPGQ